MAFAWDNYQTDTGINNTTGRPNVDPTSLQFDPSQTAASSPLNPANGGGGVAYNPYGDPNNPLSQQGGTLQNQTQPVSGANGPISMQAFNQAWLSSPYPGTVDGLKQFMAAHPEYAQAGITLGGSKGDKVYGPNNTYWGDAVISAGTGGAGKSGLSGDTGGGVNGSAGGTLGSLGYSFGSSMAPFTGQFAAPTAAEAQATPGVQFGLDEANRMMQNSGAAHGTLLNGRFQQALAASNVGNALQDYGNIYNRALSTFGTNYGIFKDNQDRPFDKNVTLAKLGQPQ
jgi:hypothetical protein